MQPNESKKNKILFTIFLISLFGLLFLLYNGPQTQTNIFKDVGFPPSVQDLKHLSSALGKYKDEHYLFSIFLFVYVYTLMQAFAIPGPIFLCILAPTLYGAVGGFILALSCSCFGASLCYYLSHSLAKSLVLRKFPKLFSKFHNMVNAHKNNLEWYILFLRLTPLIPNWFVNLASPLVGIPYRYFLVATIFGLMPNNYILMQTGLTLQEIDKIGFSFKNFATLLTLAFLSLIPTLFKKKYEQTHQQQLSEIPNEIQNEEQEEKLNQE